MRYLAILFSVFAWLAGASGVSLSMPTAAAASRYAERNCQMIMSDLHTHTDLTTKPQFAPLRAHFEAVYVSHIKTAKGNAISRKARFTDNIKTLRDSCNLRLKRGH